MNKRILLIITLIVNNYYAIAQPQLINDVIVNDSLRLKHFCTKNEDNYKEWRTILYNNKSNKELEINEITVGRSLPRYLKSNRFTQIFSALLCDKKLYTLVYNFGILSINCKEFDSPTTFKSTTYPITSHKVFTYTVAPHCHGQLKKIEDDIYIYMNIFEKTGRSPVAGGLYKFTPDEQLFRLNIEDNFKRDNFILDKKYPEKGVFEDIDLDENRQMLIDTLKSMLMRHLPADSTQSFEYLGYFTNRAPNIYKSTVQQYVNIYFLYRLNGKMNYIEYYIDHRDNTQWIIPRNEMLVKPIEYTSEIMRMVR